MRHESKWDSLLRLAVSSNKELDGRTDRVTWEIPAVIDPWKAKADTSGDRCQDVAVVCRLIPEVIEARRSCTVVSRQVVDRAQGRT